MSVTSSNVPEASIRTLWPAAFARQDNVLRLQRIDDRLRRDAKAGQPGVRRGQEDALRLHAEQLDPLDTGKAVQLPARIPGNAAHLLQREAVAPQRDCGERGQTELVINERSIRAFGQLRHRIAHLVAQHLPDALDFRAGHPVVDFHVDRRPAVLRRRPYVVDFADFANFFFQRAGDQVFDLMHFHAGMRRGDDGLADLNRRIFLSGIIEEDEQADQRNCDENKNGDAIRLDGEFGDLAEHLLLDLGRRRLGA